MAQKPGTNFQPVDYDPFGEPVVNTVPTTEAQREILANILFGGHAASCAYNESVSLHLTGSFNPEALQKAVKALVERHEALRTNFSEDGMFFMVNPVGEIPVEIIDLSSLPTQESDKKCSDILHAEAEFEFNLFNGFTGSIKLIHFANDKHQLILTFHHIICDGWSLGIMMQDLGKLYSAFLKNRTPELEPAEAFSDYAIEESGYIESDEHNATVNYWLQQYNNSVPQLELPVNKPRPTVRTYNANRFDIPVPSAVINSLKKVGAAAGTTYITTLTAAFEIYISRVTGSNDIVVGLAAAGQSATGKYNLVGHCVNLLPLRSQVTPGKSFTDYLKFRKSQILDAYDHQRFTFGSLIRKLNIPRDPGRIPLVPVSFNVDLGITSGVEFEGCTFHFTTNPRHYENFEIFINAAGDGNELILECTYNTDLFTHEMMQLRMEEFVELLNSIVSEPSKPVSLLNILSGFEKQKLFTDWQGKSINFNTASCIQQVFEKSASENADKTALIYNDVQISYRQLNEDSNRLANYLVESGIGPDVLVAIYMERSPELITALLAVLKAGGAYVPLDLSNPSERIRYIVDDTKAALVITQQKFKDQFQNADHKVFYMDQFREITKSYSSEPSPVVHTGTQLAYVIYTSGSTGNPKGVAIEHATLVNYISYCNNYYFGDRDLGNFGLYSSLSFDLTVTSIYCSLTRGKSLTIFNQDDDIAQILGDTFSEKSKIDSIKLTPAHVMLLESMGLKSQKVKKAIVGGEELLPRHVEILRSINSQMEMVNEYGPTEATVGCVIKDVVLPLDATTIGKPIYNTEIFVLDQNLQPVPPGITGRLFIGGAGLARCYLNRQSLTDEKFQILTINDEPTRVYDSGDLASYRIDGDLNFLGRIDNQVKIRGYRVELGEIESAISKIPGVKEQTVIVREDEQGDKRIIAYLVLNNNSDSGSQSYRDLLSGKLPVYMIPSDFMVLEQIPLTPNGKVDHKQLPLPGKVNERNDPDSKEPQTPIEQVLANIWCSVLKVDRVNRKDNFFELGGHSILGVKMLNEVEKQLGVKVNLSMLFSSSTVEELARLISKEGPSKPINCLVPLQTEGSKSPLFCIHMHNGNVNRWRVMIKHLGKDQPIYAIQPQGLDIHKKPHTSIEEMARFYIGVMKEIQPVGPYNLIGLCFSGMVVYDMAVQLQAMGEKVSFLAMINNYAPPESRSRYRLQTGLHKVMEMSLSEKLNFATGKAKNILQKFKVIPPQKEGVIEEVQVDEVTEEIGNDLRTIHSLALLHYLPKSTYQGDLVLFRNAGIIEYPYNEFLGWERLVKGHIETTVIEGCDNDTIITDEPYNAILSRKVKEYLDQKAGNS